MNYPQLLKKKLFISCFPVKIFYNLFHAAGSLYGYMHTLKAKTKMKAQYLNKNNHPMYGKIILPKLSY
jgi:hypothetical protein